MKDRIDQLRQRSENHEMSRFYQPGQSSSPGSGPVRVRIKEIFANYLRCLTWDGTHTGTTNLLVAVPYELRHVLGNYSGPSGAGLYSLDTVNAQTVTAKANISGSLVTETWKIAPAYFIDAEIWIQSEASGLIVSGNELKWSDTNRAGRQWAVAP